METEGTQGTHEPGSGRRSAPVPRPARPARPAVPPMPRQAPAGPGAAVAQWLSTRRPRTEPGVWRYGFVPRAPRRDETVIGRKLLVWMVASFLAGILLWSLWRHGTLPYQWVPLKIVTPDAWWWPGTTSPRDAKANEALVVYQGVAFGVLVFLVGRFGAWGEGIRHFVVRRPQPARALIASVAAVGVLVFVWPAALGLDWRPLPIAEPVLSLVVLITGGYGFFTIPALAYTLYGLITLAVLYPFARLGGWLEAWSGLRARKTPPKPAAPPRARAEWAELRAAGQDKAADVLALEVAGGRMNDVDCVRVARAWKAAARRADGPAEFTDTVVRQGGAAWTHPSKQRDLPVRTATHDLLVGQVRIGRFARDERNPYPLQGAGAALDPSALGTSLLAVGPSGAGKTAGVIRPVVESLALQALTGRAAVIAVCAAGTPLGPDDAYDVVVRPGDPASVYDLDLYADATDPDEAASFLAEGLVGDLEGVDTRRAATALAQLLGPYRTAHGHFPSVPVLRELLEGDAAALADLRSRLSPDADAAMRRELDARQRQSGTAGDPGPVLADRLAVLDRPVFAGFFDTSGAGRPFSVRSVTGHPLRVRVDLPEQGHEEASRLLARLLLAQFASVVRGRGEDAPFACLVLDDAARTVTAETVRAIQRLRSARAGVVLGLRTVGEVAEPLQGPLYAAVGCRMAFSGVSTWDGRRFAEAWGTEWVEREEVAQHTVYANQPLTRALHSLRKMVTGKAVTTDAVTVRQVERERWSASDLAHAVPPGHAVLSLTTVRGEHAPPLLVDLRA
ncbi:ATP/GTP-binding protein [Streptomyces sp. VRA16 Mangrove soil]|uniref:ATP/GTP-binding protein n=1 Tax=Streptomyces sp. VRA16 Mangrove soil TaxID=2817434 RepID=UPI001A9DE699|nr:ATP/GTP-binding protein [Streptomyces sp. VRA16 Mangrove soil]MBO1335995.1 ATP/GTP-binding protein [Streptomyces sp. VRA16 Mangrove soil]